MTIQEQFRELADKWYEETSVMSSMRGQQDNKNYLQILEMGKDVIPYIFEEVRQNRGFWYHALYVLCEMTPETQPDTESVQGKIFELNKAYLEFGIRNGFIDK